MWLTPNGLGNRVAETITGWQMADELGCEYLFDRDGFERSSIHGAYHGVADFLGIGRGLRTWADSRDQITNEIELHQWPSEAIETQCNTLYKAEHTRICRFKGRFATWCTYSTEWDRHKWRLRENFRLTNPWLRLAFGRSRSLSVAWHLRSGDIVPDRGNVAFYERIRDAIRNVVLADGTRVELHIVFRNTEPALPAEYAFLQDTLCGLWRCTLHWDENVTESIRTLISADVLVTSRSSFSYVAALYTKSLVLFETPKEECSRCYWVSDYMRVDKSGHIFEPEEFAARLRMVLRSKHRQGSRQVIQ